MFNTGVKRDCYMKETKDDFGVLLDNVLFLKLSVGYII